MDPVFLTIGIILTIGLLLHFLVYKSEKQDKAHLDGDFEQFTIAAAQKDVKQIHEKGRQLIFNKHLKQAQLTYITDEISKWKNHNEAMHKLNLEAFNKQLDYDRPLPSSGISGGKPQSW